jgi:hypothetical protein
MSVNVTCSQYSIISFLQVMGAPRAMDSSHSPYNHLLRSRNNGPINTRGLTALPTVAAFLDPVPRTPNHSDTISKQWHA